LALEFILGFVVLVVIVDPSPAIQPNGVDVFEEDLRGVSIVDLETYLS
jgi:hypothetical protein